MIDKKSVALLFAKHVANHKSDSLPFKQGASYEDIINMGLPWLELAIKIPVDIILKEIEQIETYFVDHRTDYNNNQGWKSFCIHGKSFDTTQEVNDDRPYIWTSEAEQYMPNTVTFFKTLWPGVTYRRLRVMKLEPGASIEVHKDRGIKGLAEINIAITQPNGCNFYMENHGIVPFKIGQAYMLDISNRHCVINNSNEIRYHIIVHHEIINDNFKQVIRESYNKLYDENSTY